MIILDDVCFAYDDRPILSHLTERIEPGQAVLLTGPNGSGKSTLLRPVSYTHLTLPTN